MPRLVYITTAPIALNQLCKGQLVYLRKQGYDVIAVANPGDDLEVVARREGVQAIGVPMEREISPLADLVSLWRLWRLIRRLHPDVVTTATSKASLLGMLAAWIARVPVRIYQLWGLRFETTRGLKRRILRAAELATAACAQRVFSVGRSLRRQFIINHCAPPEK